MQPIIKPPALVDRIYSRLSLNSLTICLHGPGTMSSLSSLHTPHELSFLFIGKGCELLRRNLWHTIERGRRLAYLGTGETALLLVKLRIRHFNDIVVDTF